MKPLYDGPDAHNTCLDIPEGEIDVFNIVAGRRRLDEVEVRQTHHNHEIESFQIPSPVASNRSLKAGIVPGKGWEVWEEPEGYCDGTYDAVCGRSTDNECILLGHHD
jgi:hypothetical protein